MELKPSIDIIIGPMFSGKTTELFKRLSLYVNQGFNVLYINSNVDTRGEFFSTHNKETLTTDGIDMLKISSLRENIQLISDYDVVGIDESQFFTDLKKVVVDMVETLNMKFIIVGLNGDFNREPFGQTNELITVCDTITKLNAICMSCSNNEPALFSKRVSNVSKEQILIGDKDHYIPVCRKCYQ